MILRKITIDNNVKHIVHSEQTRGIKTNKIENNSLPSKQSIFLNEIMKKLLNILPQKYSEYINE